MNCLLVFVVLVGAAFASKKNEANINIYLHLSDDAAQSDVNANYATTMHYAQCEMEPNPNQPASLHHHVHGSIEMPQLGDGEMTMSFHLTGFNVSDDFKDHNHGLQIHEYGDMEHGCVTIGELYHGEHVQGHANPGDLGDLHDDDRGNVTDTRKFDWLTIGHEDGILGRSLAILQGDHTSHTAIIACCVIGRSHAH
uniref:Extracellular superoxide dismutase n=1 Tax=Saccostrea glomerata TaxID=157728 RepID=C4NWI6_9BIVA|nr:extracellular superoxide dismutase [Saccostrea glomerata]